MAILLDKTYPRLEYFDSNLTDEARRAIRQINLRLEKTPIYQNYRRSKPIQLIETAKDRISFDVTRFNAKNTCQSEVLVGDILNGKYSGKDRADLYIRLNEPFNLNVIVEFDSGRADQIAKKFVSRVALLRKERLVYVAYCYPGTPDMNINEVCKYFEFMKEISVGLKLSGFVGMAPPRNMRKEWGIVP